MSQRRATARARRVYAPPLRYELAAGYADWAAAYDRETIVLGYCLPFAITAWCGTARAKGLSARFL